MKERRRKSIGRLLALIALAPATLVALGQHADGGTFPGLNGKIAFARGSVGGRDIYVMNVDGSQQTRLTAGSFDSRPSWSPDGSKIAFDRSDDIYVMNEDGTGARRLTANEPDADLDSRAPSWSPDGSKIAFERERLISAEEDPNDIYSMNADGSAQTALTSTGNEIQPAWSPDGSRIAFASRRDGNFEIYVMNADGSDERRLTNDPAIDWEPSWSPDGSRIAFETSRDGSGEIHVVDVDGSNERRLTTDATGCDCSPSWSPDGNKIAFASERNGNPEIYVMNADGSQPIRLTADTSLAFDVDPDWQPLPRADLALSMGATPDSVKPGQELTYTITVRNNGPSNAQKVVVTDPLPSDSRFRSVTATKGSCTHPEVDETGTVRCAIGFMPATGVQSAQIVVRFVIEDTTVSNTATVSSLTPDPIPSNNSATVSHSVGSARADLSAALGASPNPVRNGQNLTYTTTVRNLGPDPALGVTLKHQLPGGVQFLSATPSQGTCTKPPVGGTGTVSCSLGTVNSGGTATLKVVVRVVTSNTTLTSTATAAAATTDPNATNNKATAKTKVCGFLIC